MSTPLCGPARVVVVCTFIKGAHHPIALSSLPSRPTFPRVDWTSLFSWMSQHLWFYIQNGIRRLAHEPASRPPRLAPGHLSHFLPFLGLFCLIGHRVLPILTAEYLSHPAAPPHPLIQATIMFYFLIGCSVLQIMWSFWNISMSVSLVCLKPLRAFLPQDKNKCLNVITRPFIIRVLLPALSRLTSPHTSPWVCYAPTCWTWVWFLPSTCCLLPQGFYMDFSLPDTQGLLLPP